MKLQHLAAAAALLVFSTGPAFALQGFLVTAQSDKKATQQTHSEVKEDLGDVQPAEQTPLLSRFRASAQAQGEWISNAALLGNGGEGDFLFLPTLDVGFNQPLPHGFSFDLDAKFETVVYSQDSDRGFYGVSGSATFDWRPRPNLPRIFVSAEPYRYNSFDTDSNVAGAFVISTGVDQGFFINRGKTLLYGGYKYSQYHASPSLDDRGAHRLTAGVTHQFKPSLYGQLYYSFQYSDYREQPSIRHDRRNVVGLNFVYQLSEHLFTSLTSSYVDNGSSRQLARYQNYIVGAAVTWQF